MIPLVDPTRSRRLSRADTPWLNPTLQYTISGLALIATAVAAYLTWTTYGQQAVIGCDGTGQVDCDAVLSSAWSKYLGLPVSALGVACYLGIFTTSLLTGGRSHDAGRWVGTALATLSLAAAGAAAWFIVLQIFAIQKFCIFCLAVHACGLAIAMLVWWSAVQNRTGQLAASHSAIALAGALSPGPRSAPRLPIFTSGPSLVGASIGGAIAVTLLIGGQLLLPPKTYDVSTVALAEPISLTPTASTEPDDAAPSPDAQSHVVNRIPAENHEGDASDYGPAVEDGNPTASETTSEEAQDSPSTGSETAADAPALRREMEFLDGTLKMELYTEAVLGSPEAKYVILEMIDYTCPHCREMHENVKLAIQRYGDQLAFVVMPVPLELECNKLLPKTDPMHRGSCRLARLALAVAKVDPEAFADFHHFLLAKKDDVPTYSQAVVRAFRLVDRKQLSEINKSEEIKQRVQKYVELYSSLSRRQRSGEQPFGLPIQIVGDKVLTGKFETPEKLFETWEEELGIRPL